MPRAGTHSASSDETVWVVPKALRPALAEEYGPVFSGKAAEVRLRRLGVFGSCGDRVTELALALDHPPFIGIVDYTTRRSEKVPRRAFAALKARAVRQVRNPAGTLTDSLRRAVRELASSDGGLIEVDGEEDMGSLALVESLPLGATVIYGIPGAGVSFVAVDVVAKEHVRALIAQMERRRVARGG
jgi:uncharacterized protein (UPF0218 family)